MNDKSLTPLQNPFDFSDHHVRTALDEIGNVWFCAKDVFEALDLVWKGRRASLENCPEKWLMVWYLQTSYGEKETIFMAEPAVYQTTFRSNKPEAIKFIEWVCEEVLTAIRKTGSYGVAKMTVGERISLSKQIASLTALVLNSKSHYERELLLGELHTLCNLAGRKMPGIEKIPLKLDQTDLFEGGAE